MFMRKIPLALRICWSLICVTLLLFVTSIYWASRILVLLVLFIYYLPQLLKETKKENIHKKKIPPLNSLIASEFLTLTENDIQQKLLIYPNQSGMMDYGMSVAQWESEDGYIECYFQSGKCYHCTIWQNGTEIDHAACPPA